jgi:hypothetical protein
MKESKSCPSVTRIRFEKSEMFIFNLDSNEIDLIGGTSESRKEEI